MNIQNIVKIISAVLGVLGVIFLFRIIGVGDEEIKMLAMEGDFGIVSPLVALAQVILIITVVVTLVFSLMNLATDSKKLKKALIFMGCFLLVIAVGFALSSGQEVALKDGEILSASGSRWVETGIRVFYILSFLAIASMLFSGVKKILNR